MRDSCRTLASSQFTHIGQTILAILGSAGTKQGCLQQRIWRGTVLGQQIFLNIQAGETTLGAPRCQTGTTTWLLRLFRDPHILQEIWQICLNHYIVQFSGNHQPFVAQPDVYSGIVSMQFQVPPMAKYLKKSQPEMRGSLGFLGGLSMMSRSGGLNPRAVAGRPSVTRLTHSSWTGIKASGRPKMAVRKILDADRTTF